MSVSCSEMPGLASATGLLPARPRSLAKPKHKLGPQLGPQLGPELASTSRPAPFVLKPFAGLYNPYPGGCSVLCNHPAEVGAKEVVRRVKETLVATDGRGGLPEQVGTIVGRVGAVTLANSPIPEEFFRRYTETDSRPISPPLEAAGQLEKPSLVVDLRAEQPDQDCETLTWRAITLGNPPAAARKLERTFPPCRANRQVHEQEASADESLEGDSEQQSPPATILRRRGKPLRTRKRRRRPASTYGLQAEVRQPAEPAETQVSQSHATEQSHPTSSWPSQENAAGVGVGGGAETRASSAVRAIAPNLRKNATPTFLPEELLQHLCRQLNRERVEIEFSFKRRLALEEALRVMEASGGGGGDGNGDGDSSSSSSSKQPIVSERAPNELQIKEEDAPRFFTRRAVTFEILGSASLCGLTPMGYLARHARIAQTRLRRYREMFNELRRVGADGAGSRVAPSLTVRALSGVLGKALTDEQTARLQSLVGEIEEPLDFTGWCGLCAAAERLLPMLPPRSLDPPSSLEAADFEMLDRRLRDTRLDPRLAVLLTEIRDT